jgi:hypothetical protein
MGKRRKDNSDMKPGSKQTFLKTGRFDSAIMFAGLFLFSALYFYILGNYLFFYQENLSLFLFTGEYFHQFATKPGGLLEYAGLFLTQWYFSFLYGSLIISGIYVLIAIVFYKIIKKIFPDNPVALAFSLAPSLILMTAQLNFNWLMHNNLGILLAGFTFLITLSSERKIHRALSIALFPLIFYFLGGYSWLFFLMLILYLFYRKKFTEALILTVLATITIFVSGKFIFLHPFPDLLLNPLPVKEYFLYIVFGVILLAPLLLKMLSAIKIKDENRRQLSVYGCIFLFVVTFFGQSRIYDPNSADLFRLEKLFFDRDWDGVIKHQEETQSSNFVAQYYYNTALAEKGLLSERMFFSRQDFGTRSLMIPWDSRQTINKIFRGAYFFYTIGLVNEAHRWAFESMVIQGYTPENIKLLIKTELINGHYKVAWKYIYVLKKTLHYCDLAGKYESMLYHPELVQADPELGTILALKPKEDFPVSLKNPQLNILLLLQSNAANRRAFEYKLAWLMLEKNVPGVVSEIANLKNFGYTRIPRHVEEAAVIAAENGLTSAEPVGFMVSPETVSRYSQYLSSMALIDRTKPAVRSGAERSARNTFWFYLDQK